MSGDFLQAPERQDQTNFGSQATPEEISLSPLSEVPSDFDKCSEAVERPSKSKNPAATGKHKTPDNKASPRSKRKRIVPLRVTGESEDEIPRSNSSPPITPNKPKRQPLRGNWSKDHLLKNRNSTLTMINLSSLLNSDQAWTSLSTDQQIQLVTMLPNSSIPEMPALEPLPNLVREHLKGSPAFRADIRLFQEDLAAGRYDPRWLRDATRAMEERACGDFDKWKERNREEFWGQKQKVLWTALAGESSQHSLPTLVAAGLCKVGDVWMLSRGMRKGGPAVHVEKEATITGISPDNTLSFGFPPGQRKFSGTSDDHIIKVSNINGPLPLSNAILEEDGRIINVRGANAWREFRCFRDNQDMGSLFDIRELYHQRQSN